MAEFTFGLNIETLILVFCVVLSACVIVAIGYFVGNNICNKKSVGVTPTKSLKEGVTPTKSLKEQETLWTPAKYEALKDKINLVMKSETVETYQDPPDSSELLKCVTNIFTLDPNAFKLMEDSNFNSIVKKLVERCKESPNPDPGPPIWTPSAIETFKSSVKKMLHDRSAQPSEEQFNCIVTKLVARFKNPRDMITLNRDESISLLEKTMKVCGYNPVVVGNTIIWNNPENLLQLKAKIIIVDSSILDTEGLLSCVARKISENITDPNSIDDVMINQYKQFICMMGELKASTSFPDADKNQISDYFIPKFKQMEGRDPTKKEKGCIISTCEKIFETIENFEEFKNLKDTELINTFIRIIFGKCISLTTSVDLWTESENKKYRTLINDKLINKFNIPTTPELENCIFDKLKSEYPNPNKIEKETDNSISDSVLKNMYKKCTGTELEIQTWENGGVTDDQIKEIINPIILIDSKRLDPDSKENILTCVLNKIKTKYSNPMKLQTDKEIAQNISQIYDECAHPIILENTKRKIIRILSDQRQRIDVDVVTQCVEGGFKNLREDVDPYRALQFYDFCKRNLDIDKITTILNDLNIFDISTPEAIENTKKKMTKGGVYQMRDGAVEYIRQKCNERGFLIHPDIVKGFYTEYDMGWMFRWVVLN